MSYLVVAFIGIIVAFYYDTFKWLVDSWMNNVYYSHGFIVPIISGYIIWKMRKDLINIERKESQEGLVIFVEGMILQGVAILYGIRFASGLSLVITIFGIILYMYGWKFANKVKFPILFLLLAVPLPFIDVVTPPIQSFSAVAASNLANMFGTPTSIDGLVLKTQAGSFEVALECSGMKSIISLLTLSVVYAFMLEGGSLMKSTVILSAVPLAIMGNILRIVLTLIVANTYGKDSTMTYFHDFSDVILFGIVVFGLLSIANMFGKLKFKEI